MAASNFDSIQGLHIIEIFLGALDAQDIGLGRESGHRAAFGLTKGGKEDESLLVWVKDSIYRHIWPEANPSVGVHVVLEREVDFRDHRLDYLRYAPTREGDRRWLFSDFAKASRVSVFPVLDYIWSRKLEGLGEPPEHWMKVYFGTPAATVVLNQFLSGQRDPEEEVVVEMNVEDVIDLFRAQDD